MTRAEVAGKSLDLMAPIIGIRRAETLIDTIWHVEKIPNVRALRSLLSA